MRARVTALNLDLAGGVERSTGGGAQNKGTGRAPAEHRNGAPEQSPQRIKAIALNIARFSAITVRARGRGAEWRRVAVRAGGGGQWGTG